MVGRMTRLGVTMPHITTSRIRTYYELAGTGPRLLYISGTGGDLRVKPGVFDSPLAQHFELLGYDQRGLGQTDVPDGPYSMRDYADDAAALLDALGWDRCMVMGVSFGGMMAQEFALRHPSRVERMVLACTSAGGGAGGASYPLHELADLPIEEYARRWARNIDTRSTEMERNDPAQFETQVRDWIARFSLGASEPGRAKGRALQLEARRHHDTYDRLPLLTMPVYICGGRYDGIAPPANLEALHAQIPDSQLEFFDGGHLFMVQDRAAFPRVIEFFHAT